jgi:heme/copper-type cytochrome/quinol oxidase subunit 3
MLVPRVILFGLVAAQLADAMSFTVGVSRFGVGLESNGFAAALYRAAGFHGVLLVKGAVILATVALLTGIAGRFPRLLVWGGAVATSFGIVGFLANTGSILLLS